MKQWIGFGMATVLAVHALGGLAVASAIVPSVPEINPGSLSSGLALLAGGILVLRARRRQR